MKGKYVVTAPSNSSTFFVKQHENNDSNSELYTIAEFRYLGTEENRKNAQICCDALNAQLKKSQNINEPITLSND